jgi:hypothetical protein
MGGEGQPVQALALGGGHNQAGRPTARAPACAEPSAESMDHFWGSCRSRSPEPQALAKRLVYGVEATTEDRPIEIPLGEFAARPGQRGSRAGVL